MDLAQQFSDFISHDETYLEVLKIVENNSTGKKWLIGGYLSRNLSNLLYGTGEPEKADFDFIVGNLNKDVIVPSGWEISKNKFGTLRLIKNNIEIDPIPINDIHSIKRRGLEYTIENWLTGTPLTTQSLCYDLANNKIIGDIGINSLLTKTIGINDRDSALNSAKQKGISVEEFVTKVAKSFKFKPQY